MTTHKAEEAGATHDSAQHSELEKRFERLLFSVRWILAPAYVALCFSLVILSFNTFYEVYILYHDIIMRYIEGGLIEENRTIVQVLTIVDLVLVLNLVVMVLFVGYTNFVSKIHTHDEDRPPWMNRLDYAGLKLQLLGSVIAVSAIKLLRAFMELFAGATIDRERFMWMVIFHATFVLSAAIVAVVNRLDHPHRALVTRATAPDKS